MNDPTIHTTIDLAIDAISAAVDQLRDARRRLLEADYEARQQLSTETVKGWIAEASEESVKAARNLDQAKLNEASQKPPEGTLQPKVEDRAPQTAGEVLKRIRERPEREGMTKSCAFYRRFHPEEAIVHDRVDAWVQAHLGHPVQAILVVGGKDVLLTAFRQDREKLAQAMVAGIEPVLTDIAISFAPEPRPSLIQTVMGWLKGRE